MSGWIGRRPDIVHYVWIDKSGLRGKTPKRVARGGVARGRKRGNAKAGVAAKRQSAWRGGSRGLAKAATAAKTPMAWRDRGREGVKTRKRQSGDRGKTPKRVPRQFAWPCIAAFCAFGENETEGRTSSLKSGFRGKNALGAAARGRKGRRPGESGPKGHRGIAVDHDLLCHFSLLVPFRF